ncbi:peptidase S10 [Acetobacteraceae bacterium KSS8]|uniref:Peptidase S10 n=1 Tax=Endosaccharibacter trunci TaxID=2812733 RepID=A0ABT1W5X3_9PROT|nr:peptidase S10 [Acetobacteraceae bacterium KSS8]
MSRNWLIQSVALAALCVFLPLGVARADDPAPAAPPSSKAAAPHFTPKQVLSDGSVTVRGQKIDYQAASGTLVVHPRGWNDSDSADGKNPSAEASMFYVAYFKKGVRPENRPITFVYNGGPGSATVWLHMGALGPRRVVTANDTHTDAAPYKLINNDDSLLDATDLVFIDAPGTGFGRIAGKDANKEFYGTDPDAYAFTNFISQFLARYNRFQSPKYLFGESYGTTRSAILANELASEKQIDLNGVILLSQILDYDNSVDEPENNPSVDQPYVLALPTYAATAFYHHKLPGTAPTDLRAFLDEVERFSLGDYNAALQQGTALSEADRDRIADRLYQYTGIPAAYWRKARLRVNGGEFAQTLLGADSMDTGRLDSRFAGFAIDPLSQRPEYDPMNASMASAYLSAFNDYARRVLHYDDAGPTGGDFLEYKASANNIREWAFKHQLPHVLRASNGAPNVLPDLAAAMITNPKLHVQLNQGFFDLGTPYFEGVFEMRHLPIPASLAGNVEIKQYQSGHMVYANQEALHQLHDNAADFIRRTDNESAASTAPVRN